MSRVAVLNGDAAVVLISYEPARCLLAGRVQFAHIQHLYNHIYYQLRAGNSYLISYGINNNSRPTKQRDLV